MLICSRLTPWFLSSWLGARAHRRPDSLETVHRHGGRAVRRRGAGATRSSRRRAAQEAAEREVAAGETERIKQWLLEQRFLPGSDIGGAIKYVVGNWKGLTVFLDEPGVPIDNNRTERGFRGPALGRNNFYGSHSKQGTKVAAIFYSFIETAKLNGVDPT